MISTNSKPIGPSQAVRDLSTHLAAKVSIVFKDTIQLCDNEDDAAMVCMAGCGAAVGFLAVAFENETGKKFTMLGAVEYLLQSLRESRHQ